MQRGRGGGAGKATGDPADDLSLWELSHSREPRTLSASSRTRLLLWKVPTLQTLHLARGLLGNTTLDPHPGRSRAAGEQALGRGAAFPSQVIPVNIGKTVGHSERGVQGEGEVRFTLLPEARCRLDGVPTRLQSLTADKS